MNAPKTSLEWSAVLRKTLTLVLGGGRGTRLYPLTKIRSKPAVPVGGRYRLIDVPLSNCINSGLRQIYVLTQFNSKSLHQHIRSSYQFDVFRRGFVEIMAAEQTFENNDWYQGTADAARQCLRYLKDSDCEYILILSGDQLYRMDFRQMMKTHLELNADASIAAIPVYAKDASGLGIMRVSDEGLGIGFLEKPQSQEELKDFETDPDWIAQHGVEPKGRTCIASMGIYLFNRQILIDWLNNTENYQDFGKEVFPALMRSKRVGVHLFDGYWEDIGTIKSFYEANLALARPNPPFNFNDVDAPIYTKARFLPPAQIYGANVANSIIAEGTRIESGAVIENCVIGVRTIIGARSVIRNSIIMGNDYYPQETNLSWSNVPLGIGKDCTIENAIIDKNCCLGDGVKIINPNKIVNQDENQYCVIRDGIVVVPKTSVIPDGTVI